MAFHPTGMRQRGPGSLGALFTRPTESPWKFQEGHGEASNLEQDTLFLSPFLFSPSFPPVVGVGVTGDWKRKASLFIGLSHKKTEYGEMGVRGRWGGEPGRAWGVGSHAGQGRAKGKGKGIARLTQGPGQWA